MDQISGHAGYPAFLISGIRPDIKFTIRPDIRLAGYPVGRILTPDIQLFQIIITALIK